MNTVAIQQNTLDQDWQPPSRGVVGMSALIVGESAIFAIFVVAYIYYIGKSDFGPTPRQILHVPVIGTICLLSSSLTIWLAERAIHRRHGAGVAQADLPRWLHRTFKSLRHDLLLARRSACIPRGGRPHHAAHRLVVFSPRPCTRPSRVPDKGVGDVLAFCGCGLGCGLHRGLRDWALEASRNTDGAGRYQQSEDALHRTVACA